MQDGQGNLRDRLQLAVLLAVSGCVALPTPLAIADVVATNAAPDATADSWLSPLPQVLFATENAKTGALMLWSGASPTVLPVSLGVQGGRMVAVTLLLSADWPGEVKANVKLLDLTGERLWSNHVQAKPALAGDLWRLPKVLLMVGWCQAHGETLEVAAEVDFGTGRLVQATAPVRLEFAEVCP